MSIIQKPVDENVDATFRTEEVLSPRRATPPTTRRGGGLGWLVVGLAVAAAAVAVLAANVGSDPEPTTGVQSSALVENGSINAIDHAASADAVASTGAGQSSGLVENGSITALDHAASADAVESAGAGQSPGLVENGSITAIDHAAAEAP